jgi:hypothetical protein
VVNLPTDAATAGAAGANIYIRHGGGNIVQAYRIEVDDVATATLVGAVANCYVSLPTVNTTDSNHAFDITGEAPVGTAAAFTRFYLRPQGEAWTTADRRLRLASVDEWDPNTVSYPLLFSGLSTELAPGYPPTISQVKAVRPSDLATETTGTLDETRVDAEITRGVELVTLLGGPYVLTGLLVEAQASPDMTVKSAAGWAISDARIWNPAADTSIAIAAADATNPRIDLVCVNASGAVVSSSEDAACKGTAEAVPSAPATPAHYVKLAEISVPATDTTISSGQITDSRTLHPTFAAHVADADLHASKQATVQHLNETCSGSNSKNFTMALPDCVVLALDVQVTGGTLDYDVEFYEDSGRTSLAYQAQGITVDYRDQVPWGFLEDGGTAYGTIINNSADALTDIDITITYRR